MDFLFTFICDSCLIFYGKLKLLVTQKHLFEHLKSLICVPLTHLLLLCFCHPYVTLVAFPFLILKERKFSKNWNHIS